MKKVKDQQRLIVTRGLPGAGKTTWSKSWVNEDPTKRVRVNRDDIRRMLGPYWIPAREDVVTSIEEDAIIGSLNLGYSVVIDATNLKPSKWENIYKEIFEYKDFTNISLEECIKRDSRRHASERVGEEVITKFYNKYLKT